MSNNSAPANEGLVASGRIDKAKEFVVVEFPGRVQNASRAIEALGGEARLAAAIQSEAEVLQCRPRVNDLLSRGIEGTFTSARMLVLRVRRRKNNPHDIQAEIVGAARKKYTFSNLADFQTTAPPAYDVMQSIARIPHHFDEGVLTQPAPVHMPLPQYTQHGQPIEYGFRASHADRRQKGGGDVQPLLTGRRRRLPREGNRVLYDDPTPTGPVGSLPPLGEAGEEALAKLRELFRNRPIWSKRAVLNSVPRRMHDQIRAALPHIAYFMRSGPWRALWIRYGYDPRATPEAKIYQMVFLRIDPAFYLEYLAALPPKFRDLARPLGAGDGSGSGASRRRKAQKGAGPATLAQVALVAKSQPEVDEETRQVEHIFRRQNPPTIQQGSYQVCDLHEVELQDLVNRGTNSECTPDDGWCLPGTLTAIRERINAILREIASKPQANQAGKGSEQAGLEASAASLSLAHALPTLGEIDQWLGSDEDLDDEAMFGSDSENEEGNASGVSEGSEDDDDDDDLE